jgi:hypothetical protein
MAVFVEDWGANYGSAYLVTQDDAGSASAELVEDGPDLITHDGVVPVSGDGVIAFVDGVRRGEASLWQEDSAGRSGRGVAGGHACGAVISDSASAEFGESRVQRMVIWGAGMTGALPAVRGGWSWAVASVGDVHPDAPLKELQIRMRQEEGRLAEDLCAAGCGVREDSSPGSCLTRSITGRSRGWVPVSVRRCSGLVRTGIRRTCGWRLCPPRQARGRASSVSRFPSRPGWPRRSRLPTGSPG